MEPLTVSLEIPAALRDALDVPLAELPRKAREMIVLELFREGEISSGKAAEILDLSRTEMLALLADRGIPLIDMTAAELQAEVSAAIAASDR
jgi:predicted HTH domain antitoxin